MPRETDLFFGQITEEIVEIFGEDSRQLHDLTGYIKHHAHHLGVANNPSVPPIERQHAATYARATIGTVQIIYQDELNLHRRFQEEEPIRHGIIGEMHS